jgi:hypothetical protein
MPSNSPPFTARNSSGKESGAKVEPTSDRGSINQQRGFARQVRKDPLGDILGLMGISADPPQSGKVDHRKVPMHKLGERSLGTVATISAQKF